jgi:hypothetical protein
VQNIISQIVLLINSKHSEESFSKTSPYLKEEIKAQDIECIVSFYQK